MVTLALQSPGKWWHWRYNHLGNGDIGVEAVEEGEKGGQALLLYEVRHESLGLRSQGGAKRGAGLLPLLVQLGGNFYQSNGEIIIWKYIYIYRNKYMKLQMNYRHLFFSFSFLFIATVEQYEYIWINNYFTIHNVDIKLNKRYPIFFIFIFLLCYYFDLEHCWHN